MAPQALRLNQLITLRGCENIPSHARQPTMTHYIRDTNGETVPHIVSLGEKERLGGINSQALSEVLARAFSLLR